MPETTALLAQRFDHIFYTGNGSVGRVVMRAAAEHLTPVTLELGGKSPAFVDAGADLAVVAERLVAGKFLNAGQTCVAPDYVLTDPATARALEPLLAAVLEARFGEEPATSPVYGRIVNERHFDRLVALLDSGRTVVGGGHDRALTRCLRPPPTGSACRGARIHFHSFASFRSAPYILTLGHRR